MYLMNGCALVVVGIVQYYFAGVETRLDGIFLISLEARGLCLRLMEWWHKADIG